MRADLPLLTPCQVRGSLLAGREIALVDVREEDPYAQAHPLFAVQLSAARIELDAPWRLPRRDVVVVVYADGPADNLPEGLAATAARKLQALGYTQVFLLAGGLAGWRDGNLLGAAGASTDERGELFRDVNVPSKAFGELVAHERHTPSLPAEAVKALQDSGADVVVLDVRRFDEFQTMCIPGGTSVPGAELLLHVRDLAPDPRTQVIVNCAGRTRSIIGTQSLVNAGIPNPVAALRNGTIGWLLAGQALAHGQTRRFGPVSVAAQLAVRESTQALAERAGALRLDTAGLAAWAAETQRTLYRWDVRTPEEYAAGHLPGFGSAPGGQLVQETDVFAAVRGARIVLADGGQSTDGVRAAMTAHWLAQMGWTVAWLTDTTPAQCTATGPWLPTQAAAPEVARVTTLQLAGQLLSGRCLLIDLGTSAQYASAHIPGAAWALRVQLPQVLPEALRQRPEVEQIVLTCGVGALSCFAAADVQVLTGLPVAVLAGGNAAWSALGQPMETGETRLLSPRSDRYRRPYEGTSAPREAMQGYLDWEFGLVDQLARDGTHGFKVLPAR